MMGIRNTLIKSILPLLLVAAQTSATKCDCEGYLCLNDSEFVLCRNGEIVGDPILCNEGIRCRNETECSRQPLCQERHDPSGGNKFHCPGVGLFADPNNCQQFYQCDEYQHSSLKQCDGGTYFDEKLEECVSTMPERCREEKVGPACSDDNEEKTTEKDSATKSSQTDQGETTVYHTEDTEGTTEMPGEGITTKKVEVTSMRTERTDRTTTIVSTPDYEYDFICPSEGYFSDPKDCRRYYICDVHNRPRQVTCLEGTFYHEEYKFCSEIIPERCRSSTVTTERVSTSTQTSSDFVCPDVGFFADPENCHRYYICIDTNHATLTICPNGTYFDERDTLCSDEIPERCGGSTKPDGFSSTSTEQPTTTTEMSTITTRRTNTTTESPRDGFDCPGEGYFSDPDNCRNYFVCFSSGDSYVSKMVTCPENTFFDEKSEFCTTDLPARCQTGYSTTPPPRNDDFLCPSEGFYADPRNCSLYYMCTVDFAIPLTCPGGMYFDTTSKECTEDVPERCRLPGRPLPDEEPPTTPSVPPKEFTCPREGFYPDLKDCQSYYICFTGNQFIHISCPRNTFYDEKTTLCKAHMPDRCRTLENPTDGTTTPKNEFDMPPTTPAPEKDGFECPAQGYYPDPKDCHQYYACFGFGSPIRLTCPDNTYFDGGFCSAAIPERCKPQYPSQPNSGFTCPSSGRFADPKDCQKYWICFSKNFGYSVQCPKGTYYHKDSADCKSYKPEWCREPSDSDYACPGEGYFPNPNDCHSYYVCYSNRLSLAMRCPENTYYHQNMEGCASEKPDTCRASNEGEKFDCPHDGLFPNTNDCSSYYHCNFQGEATLMKCPREMYFHEDIQGCSSEIPPRCRFLTPPLENGFFCPKAGYFADPYNCSVYHVCNILGRNYTASCPTGLYYHEDTRSCTPVVPDRCVYLDLKLTASCSEKAQEEEPLVTGSGNVYNNTSVCPGMGLFPDPYDCRKFYVCYGEPRQVTCWGNTFYNDKTQRCEMVMPERCLKDETTQRPNVTPQPDGYVCPGTGIFPDPNDCHNFYVCYGEPRQVTCRNRMYFDEESLQCVFHMPARCRNDDDIRPPPTSQPGEFFCPSEGIFPDLDDCRKFYVCYQGQMREVTCREGTYFNQEIQMCDEEMPERCKPKDQTTTRMPPTTTTTEMSTTPRDTFECRSIGRFPDPTDCHSFYLCNWRKEATHFSCKYSMYFNDITSKCQPEIPDRCLSDEDREVATTPKSPSDFVCREAGRYQDPEDCLSYFYCFETNSIPRHFSCPVNQFFDAAKGKCKKIKTGYECLNGTGGRYQSEERDSDECDDEDDDDDDDNDNDNDDNNDNGEEFQCTKPGRFPDFRDCKKFYLCTTTLRMKQKRCGGKSVFNEKLGHCSILTTERCRNHGLHCTENRESGDICSTNGFDDDNADWDNFLRSKILISEDPLLFVSANDSTFECTTPGYFGMITDCKKYYLCTPTLELLNFSCPGKLYFNEEIKLCSSKLSAKCLATLYPTTTNSPTVNNTANSATLASKTTPGENTISDLPTEPPTSLPPVESFTTTTIETNTNTGRDNSSTVTYPFSCKTQGVFGDPTDPKKYYRCGTLPTPVMFVCPGKLIFNNNTKKCSSKLPPEPNT